MQLFQEIFSKQHNSIYVHTSKQQYYSGEVVDGTVHLSVSEPMHLDAVNLKVAGYQESWFARTETIYEDDPNKPGEKRPKTIKRTFAEEREFFRRRVNLFASKSTLQPGIFVFPFQFTVDAGLPGTCSVEAHDFYRGRVYYEVKCEAVVPGFFKANVEHRQEILICEPLRQALVGSETYKEENVTFLCCIPKGTVSLSAVIDRNAYAPGDTVSLRLQVNNTSKVHLKNCSLKLSRRLTLFAKGETYFNQETICKTNSPSVPPGESIERIIQMRLPDSAPTSTRSDLVKCDYSLVVTLKVPWSADVVITQPVQLVARPRESYLQTLPSAPDATYMSTTNITPGMFQTY